jgi:hypothetical protein
LWWKNANDFFSNVGVFDYIAVAGRLERDGGRWR